MDLAWALQPLRIAIRINLVMVAKAFVTFCRYLESLVCSVMYFSNSACQRVLGGWEADSNSGSWAGPGQHRPGRELEGTAHVEFLGLEPMEQPRRWLFGFGGSVWALARSAIK